MSREDCVDSPSPAETQRLGAALGRGGPGGQVLAERVSRMAGFGGGIMGVDEVAVFGSVLERKGPTYHVLSRAALG